MPVLPASIDRESFASLSQEEQAKVFEATSTFEALLEQARQQLSREAYETLVRNQAKFVVQFAAGEMVQDGAHP